MATHVVGLLKSHRDQEKFAAYREVAGEALTKHGGRVVSSTPGPEQIEGDADGVKAIVLLEFPDGDAARAWRTDPDLQDTHALRVAGVDMSLYVL